MKYYLILKNKIPYGWTFSKLILKLFLKQRNKKYSFIESSLPELERVFNEDGILSCSMINSVKLKSVLTGTDFLLYITADELRNVETLIQRLVRDQAKLSLKFKSYDTLMKAIWMILNLKNEYSSALFFLGYRPNEITGLFPENEFGSEEGLEEIIDSCYEEMWLPAAQYNSIFNTSNKIPSLHVLPDLYSKIIYSLESFIKVLREELKK